jgi:hypothetical protein
MDGAHASRHVGIPVDQGPDDVNTRTLNALRQNLLYKRRRRRRNSYAELYVSITKDFVSIRN